MDPTPPTRQFTSPHPLCHYCRSVPADTVTKHMLASTPTEFPACAACSARLYRLNVEIETATVTLVRYADFIRCPIITRSIAVAPGHPDTGFVLMVNDRSPGAPVFKAIKRAMMEALVNAGLQPKGPQQPAESNISQYDLEHIEDALLSGTNFTACLLRLIAKADPTNKGRLDRAYPEVVEAYERWYLSSHPSSGKD